MREARFVSGGLPCMRICCLHLFVPWDGGACGCQLLQLQLQPCWAGAGRLRASLSTERLAQAAHRAGAAPVARAGGRAR